SAPSSTPKISWPSDKPLRRRHWSRSTRRWVGPGRSSSALFSPKFQSVEAEVLNAYGIMKSLHVLSVVIWIGGLTALAFVTWRVANERNRSVLTEDLRQSASYGQRVVGAAAVLVLYSGLAWLGIGHIGFGRFWEW